MKRYILTVAVVVLGCGLNSGAVACDAHGTSKSTTDDVVKNQTTILANQKTIIENEEKIIANQEKIIANQGKLDTIIERLDKKHGR